MTQYDDKIYEEILEELEASFKEGKIDEGSYNDLKARYQKKLEEAKIRRAETQALMSIHVSGSQSITSDALKISGSAHLPGGVVPKQIKIAGSAKIESDIECNGLRCAGSMHAGGAVLSHGDVSISGSFHGDGPVIAEGDVDVSGSAKVGGNLEVTGIVTVSGSLNTDGYVNAKRGVRVYGSGKVEGDMLSDSEIEVRGSVKVDGSVIAEKVKFTAPHIFRRLLRRRGRSQVDGDVIGKELVEIENIEIDGDVRGRVVKIGPNSKIDGNVEFIDDIVLAEDVELSEQPRKISPQSLGVPSQPPSSQKDVSQHSSKPIMPQFCPKCGQEVGHGLKFCPACGAELNH